MRRRLGHRTAVATALVALVALVALGVLGAGCGLGHSSASDIPKPQEALLHLGPRRVRFALDACTLDHGTVYMIGKGGTAALQAVVDVRPDPHHAHRYRTRLTATAVTVDRLEGASYEAIGAEALNRMNRTGQPPGRILDAIVDGAKVEIEGKFQVTGQAADANGERGFDLVANCPPAKVT